ncbi:hypothetical protein RBWH47_02339 [Rhodopirellula baltica WH47]|uniref:Uncharacterized protein n=1 Tax=Rhodopirellula baltica WH47 TaxID=991778 RepID=F2ARR8_RHOBT|nr:hypothetical protein RBWH47_02339 [Rhodopirellula baltica WH47]
MSRGPAPFHVWFFLSQPAVSAKPRLDTSSLTDVSGYDWQWPDSLAWPSPTWTPMVPTRRVSKVTHP